MAFKTTSTENKLKVLYYSTAMIVGSLSGLVAYVTGHSCS